MMKAQDLKNSILQMAMEGKLVPQDPNDEPASVLLERIREEKEHLIKEKKIKRNNKESFIFRKDNHFYEKIGKKGEAVCIDDEIPFEVPDNWKICRLNVVNNIYTGNSINKTEKESKFMGLSEGYNYIATKDVDFNNRIDYENGVKIPKDLEKFRVAESGSVLLCIEGGSAGRKIALTSEDVCFGNKLCCFTSYGIDNEFLYYYLQSPIFKEVFKSEKSGIIGGVSIGKIRNFFVPIPPLNEQQRIVCKIEELIPFVQDYGIFEEELNKLNEEFPKKIKDSILQEAIQGKLVPQNPNDEPASVLLEKIRVEKDRLVKEKKIKRNKNESFIFKENNHFFEKIGNNKPVCIDDEIPFDIPDSWEWCRLGFIGDWKAGSTPKRGESKYYENGTIPWLKTGDLNNGIITEIPEFITELALEETSIRLNPIGSVLIAMYGATIGKVGILDIESTTNQACCACILFSGIFNKYLFYYLMSQNKRFNEMAEGGAQPNISRTKIVNYLFPVPPLKEQKRIVEKVNNFFELFG